MSRVNTRRSSRRTVRSTASRRGGHAKTAVPDEFEQIGDGSDRTGGKKVGTDILLIVAGALLFSLAFPNVLTKWGMFPVAFVSLVPVFVVVRRATWVEAPLYGLLYGFLTYTIFNYWLMVFHPLSIFIVPVIYASYFFVLFPILKVVDTAFPRYGYLAQLVVWMAYEYLRIQGFLGYAYGIIGYSQYLFSPFIRISAITGVWGVSFLVAFPSAYLAAALADGVSSVRGFVRRHRIDAVAYAVVFVAVLVYGLATSRDYSAAPTVRAALIQQDIDPHVGGLSAYRGSLDALVRQSTAALESDPEIDIVIWSETSFVPAIEYHTRYRESPEMWALVRELLEFLDGQTVPYVIGNGDGQRRRNAAGELVRVDYNAALVYDRGEFIDTYRKVHLVPFTEHFPYERTLPWLHRLLVENDTTFWEHGDEFTVFEAAGMKFSTPICFEDTFGYLSREFIRAGAEVIVNLTNDSWSKSVPAAMQHMAMAVFRATENRRSVVRSTNGGMTVFIDPNGTITDMLPAFVEGYLIGDIPVYTDETTVYTRYGDWLAWLFLFGAIGLTVGAVVLVIVRRAHATRS